MTDVNGGIGGPRYGLQAQGQITQNKDNPRHFNGPQVGLGGHPMSYNFNQMNQGAGSADLLSNMNSLSINTQTAQSELNSRANEFVPGGRPNPGMQSFDVSTTMGMSAAKPGLGFSRRPQLPGLRRGTSPATLTPPLTHSPGQMPADSLPANHIAGHMRASAFPQPQQPQDLVQENYGGTTYFYNQDELMHTPLRQTFPASSVYVGMQTHLAHMKHAPHPNMFMDDDIKSDLLQRQSTTLSDVEGYVDSVRDVDDYCRLVPLETATAERRIHYNYECTVYKALSRKDGLYYCLHRVHGFKLTNQVMDSIGRWKEVTNPNIVHLRQVFTTKAFGDNSLVFVYDYHACSETLLTKQLRNKSPISNGYGSPFNMDGAARPFSAGKGSRKRAAHLPEATLWSYAVQLINALHTIHRSNLSANGLPPKSILIHKDRLRINCLGILDIIACDPQRINNSHTVAHLQKDDLQSLGVLLLALTCGSLMPFRHEHVHQSMELLANSGYSERLIKLISCLVSAQEVGSGKALQVIHLLPLMGPQLLIEITQQCTRYDLMENELFKSVENGRLFKLQTKLNTILERSELNRDSQWSETGDRYILKLFRDYVYHQTNEDGTPWVDMAHVVAALNKLDAGVSEKVCLSSSDETAVIVVSYAELKRCFESAFSDLLQAGLTSYPH